MARSRLADKSVLVTMNEDMHAELKKSAADAGMTMQAYIEMKVFGRIRPRGAAGPRPYLKQSKHLQEEMPLTG